MFSSQDSEMLFHSEQLESSFIWVIIDFLLSIGFKPFWYFTFDLSLYQGIPFRGTGCLKLDSRDSFLLKSQEIYTVYTF